MHLYLFRARIITEDREWKSEIIYTAFRTQIISSLVCIKNISSKTSINEIFPSYRYYRNESATKNKNNFLLSP